MSGANASVSRCASPAVGSSSRSTRGAECELARELGDAARAGGEVGDELVGEAVEPHVAHDLVGLGALASARPTGPAAAPNIDGSSHVRPRASSATSDGLADREVVG